MNNLNRIVLEIQVLCQNNQVRKVFIYFTILAETHSQHCQKYNDKDLQIRKKGFHKCSFTERTLWQWYYMILAIFAFNH